MRDFDIGDNSGGNLIVWKAQEKQFKSGDDVIDFTNVVFRMDTFKAGWVRFVNNVPNWVFYGEQSGVDKNNKPPQGETSEEWGRGAEIMVALSSGDEYKMSVTNASQRRYLNSLTTAYSAAGNSADPIVSMEGVTVDSNNNRIVFPNLKIVGYDQPAVAAATGTHGSVDTDDSIPF
jgi:hypothetical protein